MRKMEIRTDTDWIDLITHDQAAVQNYEVSVSSGSEKTRFYSSLGFKDPYHLVLAMNDRSITVYEYIERIIHNKIIKPNLYK